VKHFCTAKFSSFLLPGTFFAIFGFLNRLADSAIVGHVIGEDAFAGVNMVAPALEIVAFFAYLIALGTATNYSIWMGRLDRLRARGFFMQGLWMALAVGIGLSLFMAFGEDAYLAALDGAEYVDMYGRQYMDWIWPYGLVHGLLMLLSFFACADGDLRLCSVSYGVVFLVNVTVSYLSVSRGMGASGCAFGTVVSEVVGILLLLGHFFRRTNTLAPVWRFSWRDSLQIVRASFGDAATFLCTAALFFCVCKAVIWRFGSDLLPVAGVAIVIWRCAEIFNGIGLAAQPLVTVYWGERNVRGIRKVVQAAMVAAPLEGLALSAAFCLWPDLVIRLIGVEYPELVDASLTCVRLVCFGLVPLSVAAFFKSYYLFNERPRFSLGMSVSCYLALPVVCAFAGGALGGLNGLCGGLACGPLAGLVVMALVVLIRQGRKGFPCLLPREREEKIRMVDLVLNETEIVRASREVMELLPASVASRAALMVEEVFMTVRERNAGRSRIRGEITLDFNDGVVMTLRDDGVLFDITDADQRISSLRTYLVASVMERQRERLNLVTAGFNRNVFRFA